jgi:adhesin HecA-like repeat protein
MGVVVAAPASALRLDVDAGLVKATAGVTVAASTSATTVAATT